MVGIAALDSLNPSTVGPALILAAGRDARRRVVSFTAGVFAASVLGGVVLLFGPGRQLLARLAKPAPHTQHLVELVVGAIIGVAAAVLWLVRSRVRQRLAGGSGLGRRSAVVAGAAVMLLELPTAFPYFAALLAIVEARRSAGDDLALVLAYNAVFVAPLLATTVLARVGGTRLLHAARARLERAAPTLTPLLLAIVSLVVIAVGLAGLRRA